MTLQTSSIHSSKFFRNFIRCVNFVLVVCVIVSVLAVADKATRPAYSEQRFGEFFEKDQEYDVLFFGSSHMVHSVNPMQLWNEHGITSYNWAGYATWPTSSYWIFKNAIEYHKPKVAVLEVFASWNSKDQQSHSMLHYTLDAFPLTKTKIDAVSDMFSERNIKEELLLPFNVYHGKWSSLNVQEIQDAFQDSWPSYTKGTELLYEIVEQVDDVEYRYDSYFTIGQSHFRESQWYIVKFIEACREAGIQPVLLYVPFNSAVNEDQITDISVKYNVPFFDYYVNGDLFINEQTDLNDRAHLNISGATKITKLLGQELAKLVDAEHTVSVERKWESYYLDYIEYLRNEIESADTLTKSLLCLSDSPLSASITVNEKVFENAIYKALLDQLQEKCEIIIDPSVSYANMTVIDAQTGEMLLCKEFLS